MFFKKRIERAFTLQKSMLQEQNSPCEELSVEKKEWFALSMAGYLTLFLPAVLILGLMFLIAYLILL